MTDPVATRPLSRTEQREADILEAAIYLFANDGFHDTSTRRIAARAGISEGTLFNYFSSKNELMRAILTRIYVELTENASQAIREILGTRERLQFLAENHIGVLSRDNALFMRMIQAYMNVDLQGYTRFKDSILHKLNLSYTWVFDLVIKEGIERGDIRSDVNLSAIRDLFFGGLEYCSRTLFLHDRFDELSERVSSVVEPLWISMQPATGSQPSPTDKRLEAACKRVETAARKLEQKTA